jgi:hypothetical protein
MEPKDKALQLFETYLNVGMGNGWAKQCALVVVDEIIEAKPTAEFIGSNRSYDNVPYWMEVKQEIEKL